jgi:hypothetical protein
VIARGREAAVHGARGLEAAARRPHDVVGRERFEAVPVGVRSDLPEPPAHDGFVQELGHDATGSSTGDSTGTSTGVGTGSSSGYTTISRSVSGAPISIVSEGLRVWPHA